MKRPVCSPRFLIIVVLLVSGSGVAQDFAISWSTLDGGGAGPASARAGGGEPRSGAPGQPDARNHPEPMTVGAYSMTGGFWVIPEFPAIPADYDGDNKDDIAIWRPSTAQWWIIASSTSTASATTFGIPTDTPVPGDYDGDGKLDTAGADTDDDGQIDTVVADTDGDGKPNYLDNDDDGDGTPSASEGNDPNGDGSPADAIDTDGDKIPDYLDPVDGNPGPVPPNGGDSDGDGLKDSQECPKGVPCPDSDGDGIPNYMDTDDDNDGTPDAKDEDDDGDGLENAWESLLGIDDRPDDPPGTGIAGVAGPGLAQRSSFPVVAAGHQRPPTTVFS